jgi:hypothetical protein
MATVYILNTTVVPCEGLWNVQKVSLSYATYLAGLKNHKRQPCWTSAIGHESTAALLATLLGVEIPVNRISVAPVEGDQLLCFKLKQRAPEGKILTIEELEALGYEFYLMDFIAPSKDAYCRRIEDHISTRQLWKARTDRPEPREFLGGHRD